jgi:hypothetical protein
MSSWSGSVLGLVIALPLAGQGFAAGLVTVNPSSAYPEGPVIADGNLIVRVLPDGETLKVIDRDSAGRPTGGASS